MKTNNHYACASSKQNKLPENRQGEEGENQIKMNDTVLLAYAKYFVKFVKLYKEQDIDISAIHVQNEFNSCQVFPSCTWTSCGLAEFIKTYLGPQFKKNHIKTNIWLGTIERSNIALVDTILGDKDALKYIKGLGFQWAGKDIIETAHTKYPEMRIMQTENECGDGSNDWKAAEHTFKLMKRYLNGGANSYMYWNMILDKNGLSHWGWKQNSLITIDTKAERAYYNPEYYLFKHFSGFISKGSVKVKVIGYKDIVAFITPDDNLVIVSANLGNKAYHLRLKVGKKYIEVKLPSKSFNTFVGNI